MLLGIATECDVLKLAKLHFVWQAWDFVALRREVLRGCLNRVALCLKRMLQKASFSRFHVADVVLRLVKCCAGL